MALDCTPATALRAVGLAAEEWGAEYEPLAAPGAGALGGGRLHLPVTAGLRRGLLTGPLTVEATDGGARIVFRPAVEDYWVVTSSVAVLIVAAAGALLTVAWPLFPKLLPGAPLGAVLALCGWFLVLSRLGGRTPQDFLAGLQKLTAPGALEATNAIEGIDPPAEIPSIGHPGSRGGSGNFRPPSGDI